MEKKHDIPGRKNGIFPIILLFIMLLSCRSIFAQTVTEDDFADMISKFEDSGVIPSANGKTYIIGDYEESLAAIGYSTMIPLLEAENFVVSSKLSWTSSVVTPDSATSGCGIFFNAADGLTDHVMVSLRMDGTLNLTGSRRYNPLNYGKYSYATPSFSGNADLTFVVIGNNITIYLNGERFLRQGDLPISGAIVGLSVLSGSYFDFGTKCSFEDIHIYSWD